MGRSRRLASHRLRRGDLRGIGAAAGSLGGDTSAAVGGATVTFPTTRLAFQVMLALGADPSADPSTWVWTDVTRYLLQSPKIVIKRGRGDEESQTAPSTCLLSLRNSDPSIPADATLDGLFTPRNANGPYYGNLRRNTPLRVDIDPGTGWTRRWTGLVTNWPPESDVSGQYKAVQIRAAGILRLLGQGTAPVKSTMRTIVDYFSTTYAGLIYGYWPLEDGTSATQGASGLLDGTPAVTVGVVGFGDASPAAGSAYAPSLTSGGSISATCNSTTTTDRWVIQFLFNCSAASTLLSWATTGTAVGWKVSVTTSTIVVSTSAGAAVTVAATPADGNWHIATVIGLQSGADVSVGLTMDDVYSGSNFVLSKTVGQVSSLMANPLGATIVNSVNHIIVHAASSTSINSTDMNGNVGDAAGGRFFNAANSAGILTDVSADDLFDTELMDAQPVDTLLNVLRQAVDADEGHMAERRGGLLGFDSHASRENQAVALALDYLSGHIQPPFSPAEDDQQTRNDITVRRINGSSARSVDSDGSLGTSTVGRYDVSVNRSLQADTQAIFHSSHLLVRGTVDEARFPRVNINLTRNPSLIAAWLACDLGSRIQLTNLPAYLAIGTADLVLEGYTETLDSVLWTVELNLSPHSPHRIFRLTEMVGDVNEFVGYMVPDTWTLAADITTASAATFSSTASPLLSTGVDDWIGNEAVIRVDGEQMIITGVTGGSNPQTVSVTRSVLGTIATTHSSGATVEFATPGVLGL